MTETGQIFVHDLEKEIQVLRKEINELKKDKLLQTSDAEAKKIIELHVEKAKSKREGVDPIMLHFNTGIPFDQIGRIRELLEKEGKIKVEDSEERKKCTCGV